MGPEGAAGEVGPKGAAGDCTEGERDICGDSVEDDEAERVQGLGEGRWGRR